MAYIGRDISNLSDRAKLDAITTSATATFNLTLNSVAYVPSSAESLTVSLNGVIQAPQSSYTVSNATIVFASNLASSDVIDFILAERAITLTTIGSGTVNTSNIVDANITTSKLADDAVTTAKINDGAVTSAKLDSGLALGKIGQVINVNKVMSTTAITSTSSVAIANYEATITPTATSSKIFVLATYSYTQDGGSNGVLAFTQIFRGTSNILGGIAGGDTGNGDYGHTVSLSTVDSPNTTSATTYKIHAQVQNSSSQFRPTSNSDSLTLMEILA